ncbi:2-phosphosulfolactate phosphatase [Nitritalea halalkaliphila LW7]|uniref:Probable 2-phosphosulfolactate phosphatase n=1 Tax=Nitritalea halalkaliphila LW7 TaxID=1189621 RepID=I5C516_9BACT|nr:2-phosphosulfolactate phosphatase [Nitritalea halalkaliphila LW7]
MKTVSICLTPALRELYEVSGRIVVVVDIFRASSTMVAALCEGVDHIIPVADQEECRALGAKGYLTAGERNGHIIPGFDLGNSPLAFQQEAFKGQKLSMTTTNGTLAIEKFREGARELLIGLL